MQLFQEGSYLFGTLSLRGGSVAQQFGPGAIAKCAPPQTYTEVHVFLGLVGHHRRFTKGFACIAQPLNDHLTGEGASRKSEHVSLPEDALKALRC